MRFDTRRIRSVMACAMLGLITTAARAADNGVYAGIAVGHAETDVESISIPGFDSSVDDNDTGFKIMVGLRPLDWLGVEMNYVNLGQVSGNTGDLLPLRFRVEESGVDVLGLLFWDVAPVVDLFAKGGFIRWDADTRFDSPLIGRRIRGSDRGTDLAFGAGAQVHFGSIAARLEYEYFDIDTPDDIANKPQMISLGVTYTFF